MSTILKCCILPFDAESFLGDDIALSDVTGLVKDDLKTLARYLKIQFDSECKKPVLKELVVTCLVDIAKLPSSAIDTLLAGGGAGMYELEKAKLRLAFSLLYRWSSVKTMKLLKYVF